MNHVSNSVGYQWTTWYSCMGIRFVKCRVYPSSCSIIKISGQVCLVSSILTVFFSSAWHWVEVTSLPNLCRTWSIYSWSFNTVYNHNVVIPRPLIKRERLNIPLKRPVVPRKQFHQITVRRKKYPTISVNSPISVFYFEEDSSISPLLTESCAPLATISLFVGQAMRFSRHRWPFTSSSGDNCVSHLNEFSLQWILQ